MTYSLASPTIGVPDVSAAVTTALGAPGIANLPSVTTEAQLGQVVDAWDATLGAAKFIFLKIAVSTTVTAGLVYQWDKNYQITVVPAGSSSKNTGVPIAVAYTSVASNASVVQYAWFVVQGTVPVLKTAVAVAPQSALYMSATAGRVYATSSAGKQLEGARSQNTATVTSTTSTVNVYLQYSSIEGA